MGIVSTSQGDTINYGVNEYVADTLDDLLNLETNGIFPGSTCIVIDTTDVYILDTKKVWQKL